MAEIILKALSFVFVIIIGYVFKHVGFFKQEDHQLVIKLLLYLTLPASIIASFGNFERNATLFILVVIGLMSNAIMFFIGYCTSKKYGKEKMALYTMNFPGYNIGAFTLPFVQSFLGPSTVIMICMFDMGNALMCTGGTYAIMSGIMKKESGSKKEVIKEIMGKMLHSIPFVTYIVMMIMAICNLSIPSTITTLVSPFASANGFLAMLYIGMIFEINLDLEYLKEAGKILFVRYGAAALFTWLTFIALPFPMEVKQVLAIAFFSPITSVGVAYTEKLGGNQGLASFVASSSIILSLAVMVTIVSMF